MKGGIIKGFGVVGTIYVLGFDVFHKIDKERNGPKAVRSPERTMVAFFSDLPEIRDELIDRILTSDDNTIRKNLKASQGQRRAEYFLGASVARLDHTRSNQVLKPYDLRSLYWLGPISKIDVFEFVSHICSVVGLENLAKIANLLCQDPHAFYSRGWPDLMILGPNEFRFVEVKTTDKLHRSQIITMPEMHKVGGLDISVLQLVKG